MKAARLPRRRPCAQTREACAALADDEAAYWRGREEASEGEARALFASARMTAAGIAVKTRASAT